MKLLAVKLFFLLHRADYLLRIERQVVYPNERKEADERIVIKLKHGYGMGTYRCMLINFQ